MSIYDAFSGGLKPGNYSANDALAQARAELEQIKNTNAPKAAVSKSPSFDRLDDYAKNSVTLEKQEWCNSQTAVKEKYDTMMKAFGDFIFANYYKDFDGYCAENKLTFCSDYVDTFVSTCKNYVSPIDEQNKTIQELKKEIAEMKKSKQGDII